jgi:hypothetical protein
VSSGYQVRWYILDDERQARQVKDVREWAQYFEYANRHVANDTIGDANISTVFLGVDHRFGDGPPLIFETMIFGGPLDGEMWRYSTWDDAETGHQMAVKRVRERRRALEGK